MNILILGSSGNIGKSLKESLIQDGHSVVGISRRSSDINKDLLNITDNEITDILINNNINFVINSAGVLLPTSLDDYLLNSNVLLKFFNNQIGKNLKYIVIGSAAEYGISGDLIIDTNKTSPNPQNLYGLSKLNQTILAEYYKEHLGIDVLVFRLFNIISPSLPERSFIGSLISAITKGSLGIIQVNNGQIERDFIDLRDFVKLVKNAIKKPIVKQTIFNVGNGYNVNYQDVIDQSFKLLEKYNLPKPIFKDLNKDEMFSKSVCNIGDTKEVFGWEPEYNLQDSLEWCLRENKLIK